MNQGHFHPVGGLSQIEELAANTRTFTGDGTAFLKVPGLVKVERVRIGDADIPLEEERSYPKDSSMTRFDNTTEPLLAVQQVEGESVLMRSILSNDGMWQSGAAIFVTGEWADASGTDAPSAPKGKTKAAASTAE